MDNQCSIVKSVYKEVKQLIIQNNYQNIDVIKTSC